VSLKSQKKKKKKKKKKACFLIILNLMFYICCIYISYIQKKNIPTLLNNKNEKNLN